MGFKITALYFLLGGTIITLVTYFGSRAESLRAAFIAFFPSISVITLCTIYASGGKEHTISYVKSMLIMTPAWLAYVAALFFLMPRLGLVPSLAIGILVYVGASLLTMRLA